MATVIKEFLVIKRALREVFEDTKLPPSQRAPKIGTRFYNAGDDIAFINKTALLPGKEIVFESTESILDETTYEIDFEDAVENKKLVVTESLIDSVKRLKINLI